MNKKELIIQTAFELFANEGYHSTSTAKIAKEAGLASGLIFHHFKNKEGLLKAVIAFLKERITPILQLNEEANPQHELKQLTNRLKAVKDDRQFWLLYHTLLFQPSTSVILVQELEEIFTQYYSALELLFQRLSVPAPKQAMRLFEAQRSGIITSFLIQGADYPLESMLDNLGKYPNLY